MNLKENINSILRIKKYYKEKETKTLFEKFFENFEGVWDFSLSRIKVAIRDLNFDKIYKNKTTILVLGSNGKGTTSYLLKSIILKVFPNLKIALFTSPHIFSFKERFLINFEFFENDVLNKSFIRILPFIKKYKLTYFESSFLLALELFKNVDICIFEAGLGGRLDATNALAHDFYILTTVSKEHTNILGNSLEKIAFEKLSAVRRNSILILGEKDFYYLAKKFTSNINVYNKDFFINNNVFFDEERNLNIKLNLEKNIFHNLKALALAIKTFLEVFKSKQISSISIFSRDYPPFRVQKLNLENKIFLFDVAHNEESLKRLFEILKEEYKKYKNKYKFNLFFTFMRDKDISFLNNFLKYFKNSNFYFVSIPYNRALNFNDFLKMNYIYKLFPLKTRNCVYFCPFKKSFLINLYPQFISHFIKDFTYNIFFGSFYLYSFIDFSFLF